MKNLILITFLFMAFQGKAQTTKPIDGFLGIKFGSTAAQVTEALKAKGAVLNTNSSEASLSFSNISLGNRKVSTLFIHLINNQAFEALFVFKPELENKSIEYYNTLINDINAVYGEGKSTKEFKQPYTDGDGYEITAIKSGNANYYTIWTDTVNKITSAITVSADGSLRVRLFYTDGKLDAVNEAKKKEKNKSEF